MKVVFIVHNEAQITYELDYVPRIGERVLLTLHNEVRTFWVSMVTSRIEDGEAWVHLSSNK